MKSEEKAIEKLREQIDETLEDAFNDLVEARLPYLKDDRVNNVEILARRYVHQLLAGKFRVESGYIIGEQDGFMLSINVSAGEWDAFRESLIKLMPACPKDQKIEMLERRVEELVNGSLW